MQRRKLRYAIQFGLVRPVWSALINVGYLLCYFWRIPRARWEMESDASTISVSHVRTILSLDGTYAPDTFRDWTCWPLVWYLRDFRGDCDDYAAMAHWLLGKVGISSRVYFLLEGPKQLDGSLLGHAVCLTEDQMFSNKDCVALPARVRGCESAVRAWLMTEAFGVQFRSMWEQR